MEPLLRELADDTSRPDRGIFIREVAGGYQMATKPEHHEVIRNFVKNLKQPLKLSQAALETLAVIAYKQPITLPEILEIRGVQGAGVIKTLLERKLITTAGRKNVVGRPILYKTTREFLAQFGLKDPERAAQPEGVRRDPPSIDGRRGVRAGAGGARRCRTTTRQRSRRRGCLHARACPGLPRRGGGKRAGGGRHNAAGA